jgi:L-alanine-DL-glutamate epimerase-like enolase superfamily enzyme
VKISDVEVIEFRATTHRRPTRWGYGVWGDERPATASVTRISTDEGVAGRMLGGDRAVTEHVVKPLLVGEDLLDRERLWHWVDQMATFGARLTEHDLGIVDCALWDLLGCRTGLPVHKLLGGARDRVAAYASTAPNLGGPDWRGPPSSAPTPRACSRANPSLWRPSACGACTSCSSWRCRPAGCS